MVKVKGPNCYNFVYYDVRSSYSTVRPRWMLMIRVTVMY